MGVDWGSCLVSVPGRERRCSGEFALSCFEDIAALVVLWQEDARVGVGWPIGFMCRIACKGVSWGTVLLFVPMCVFVFPEGDESK